MDIFPGQMSGTSGSADSPSPSGISDGCERRLEAVLGPDIFPKVWVVPMNLRELLGSIL